MIETAVRRRASTGLKRLAVVVAIAFPAACGEEGPEPAADAPAIFVEGVDQVMIGVENYITRDGVRRARLDADTAYTFEAVGRLDLRNVRLTFFGEVGDTLGVLEGREAEYDLETGNVKVRGDVEVSLSSGERLDAPVIEYLSQMNEVRADSGYVLTYPDGTVDRGSYVVQNLTSDERRYGPGSTTTPEVTVPQ